MVVCSDHASEEVGIARYHNVSGQCDVIKDNQHRASCCIYIPLHPIVSVLLGRIRLLHPIVSVLLRRFHFFVCYIPRLQYFLGESISMFSFYVSSEGLLGVNKWPHKHISAYALLPESKFYEFIPSDQTESPDPEVLLTDEIEVNKDYEIVITTGEGLYRYRLGDAVQEKSPKGLVIDVVSWSYASSCMDVKFMLFK